MSYDLDHQWGEESKWVQLKGCAGCLLFILAALLIDALALVAIVNLIRAAFGL